MNNEEKVLGLFIDKNSERLELTCPFIRDGYVFATDASILIRVKKEFTKNKYSDGKINANNAFINTDSEITMTLNELKNTLLEVPKVEEVETIGEDIICDECDGDGFVEWEYKHWEKDFECPICDGSGYLHESREVKTGNYVPDKYHKIKIADRYIAVKYATIIIEALELLKVKQIKVKYQANQPLEQLIINIDENIDILVMPVKND